LCAVQSDVTAFVTSATLVKIILKDECNLRKYLIFFFFKKISVFCFCKI